MQPTNKNKNKDTDNQPVQLTASLDTPVTILMTSTDETRVVVAKKIISPRNMWVILSKITNYVNQINQSDGVPPDMWNVKITTEAVDSSGRVSTQVMSEGGLQDILAGMARYMLQSKDVARMIYDSILSLMESSPLRNIMVTAVFEDGQPFGFTLVNKSLGDHLTDADHNMLVYQAKNGIDMFKDDMRKNGVVFKDDTNILGLDGKPMVRK